MVSDVSGIRFRQVKGYALEDCYGELWEQRYMDCVSDHRISNAYCHNFKDIIRLVLKSAVETGTPFVFNRGYCRTGPILMDVRG